MIDDIKRIAGPYKTAGQTQLPFYFQIFDPTDIYVAIATSEYAVDRILTYKSDYTVLMNEFQNTSPGGTVVLNEPIVEGQLLVVGSAIPYNQTTQLTNFSRFPPDIINTALDRIVVQIQQLKEESDRAVKVPATSPSTPEDLAKDLFDARDRAEAADKNAAASASASASSAATSKSYADKVTDFKDQIIKVSDNMADVKTNAANVAAIKGIGENLTEVLKSSQYAAEAKNWAEQASAIAGSEALMMPGATQALNIGQWMLRKAQCFHNVAEMKASLVLADGMSCVTEGYYEPGDGGMGFYRIRTMMASDADDGGSIHALQNGLCAELVVENGTVNVKQFGARGDGVTDDVEKIRLAISFAEKTVIPRGVYIVSNAIGVTSNKTVCGEGEAVLKAIGREGFPFVVITLAHNVIISGITFDGDVENRNLSTPQSGVHVNNCEFVTVRNITVIRCGRVVGIPSGNGISIVAEDDRAVDCRCNVVDGCRIIDDNMRLSFGIRLYTSWESDGISYSTKNTISNNYITGTHWNAIEIAGPKTTYNNIIGNVGERITALTFCEADKGASFNVFDSNTVTGFIGNSTAGECIIFRCQGTVYNEKAIISRGNVFRNCRMTLSSASELSKITYFCVRQSKDTVIDELRISHDTANEGLLNVAFMQTRDCDGLAINGANFVVENGARGVLMFQINEITNRLSVSDSSFDLTGTSGSRVFQITSDSRHFHIIGNTIIGGQLGLYLPVTNTSVSGEIIGNVFTGQSFASIGLHTEGSKFIGIIANNVFENTSKAIMLGDGTTFIDANNLIV